jgi:hypothetical protein
MDATGQGTVECDEENRLGHGDSGGHHRGIGHEDLHDSCESHTRITIRVWRRIPGLPWQR